MTRRAERPRPRWRAAALGAALLVGAPPMLASDAPSRLVGDAVIGTFNMAGGHPVYSWPPTAPADALIRTVHAINRAGGDGARRGRRLAFLALQEVCRDWAVRLARGLAGYTVRFDRVRTDGRTDIRCRNPDFGNAVIYRDDLGIDGPPVGHDLGSPPGKEQRELLCVRSRARRLVLCSAHLTHDDAEARRAEAARARRILMTAYLGHMKIVGADLNDEPGSATLDSFYHPDYGQVAHGEFFDAAGPCRDAVGDGGDGGGDERGDGGGGRGAAPTGTTGTTGAARGAPVPAPRGAGEAGMCRSGAATYGPDRKLDYLFVSKEVQIGHSWPGWSDRSDHRPLWATVTFPSVASR